jgi:hypothetical protein
MNDTQTRPGIGPIQIGIALLALGTAGIHLYQSHNWWWASPPPAS